MTAIKETPDVAAIKALIKSFFDRINASDGKGLATLFLPGANLSILRQDPARDPASDSPWSEGPLHPTTPQNAEEDDKEEKIVVILRTSIEKFVKMIEDGEKKRKGKPGPKVHETPDLEATDVKVEHLFGAAWNPFRVTFDGVLHHYGTFAFTFGKVDGGEGEGNWDGKVWRIEGLTQNYRRSRGWEEGGEL
ncbi:uncharacterized protein CC84DRAFT_1162431 [Paraphaeosphaeria sporulosa]|uniref:SnoaL-like domain-containing protein n=1 Tax=Paraphaeosphaeria sporulosa TaxID=1460663 RepID=A0A177CLT8_9PLEO|nr:uncharacterized protein CC84DRAFT_1162431 [Paraphaeosphaeria sporulosa]OAG08483.1 hypothetical protein CC84DRAFT_1162431 [Paraphaeosphaeria sporulosa]